MSRAAAVRGALRGAGLVALTGALAAALTWAIACAWPDLPVERATVASVAFVPLWVLLAALALAWRPRAPQGALRRRLFALHRDLGGALAVIAVLVFGSGVGAVVDRALGRWQVAHAELEAPPLAEQPLDAVLADLLARHPELRKGEVSLHPASAAQPWIQADFRDARREHLRLDYDARTGALRSQGEGPLWVVRELHRRLLLSPQIGEALLGLLGLTLALVLCAGIATRRWRRELVRQRRTPQPVAMTAHQWIGLGTLPAALLWAASGAMLGLTLLVVPIVGSGAYGGDRTTLMRDVLATDRPPLVDRPAATPMLHAVLAARCPAVEEHLADAEVHRLRIRHPGLASGTVRVDLEGEGLFERGSFARGADGALRDCRALATAGPGMQSFMASIALHYGEWGPAWLTDLAYVLLGGSLAALAWLGGALLARRRERDEETRAALRLRRWLVGVGFGLPLATAALALASRVPAIARDEDLALLLFAGTFGLALACARTGELALRRDALRWTLVLALAAIPALGWLAAGVAPGAVEALLVALALTLVVLRGRAAPRGAA